MGHLLNLRLVAALLGLIVAGLTFAPSAAEAGLFRKRRDVIVVQAPTTYVVADPYVVPSTYVAVPTETVVAVPTRAIVAAPAPLIVEPARRVYATESTRVLVPARRVYVEPAVAVPVLRPARVVVPSGVVEVFP